MPLSIYTVKHPLTLNWSSYIRNKEIRQEQKIELMQKIFISLIYEASRDLVQIHHLYIKNVSNVNELHILANNPIYIISSNSFLLNILFRELTFFIPNLTLCSELINSNMEIQDNTGACYLKKNIDNKHIIILEENLECKKIITTINSLSQENIEFQRLSVCCISCHANQLQELGDMYSKLDIYTSSIIRDNIQSHNP